jgi:hypothetical protein
VIDATSEILALTGRFVVDDRDAMTSCQQRFDKVGANESGSASDETFL